MASKRVDDVPLVRRRRAYRGQRRLRRLPDWVSAKLRMSSDRRRNILVLINTALAAGSSVVLLLGAARSMSSSELSTFSLVQLIVMTAVMLQRALFLSPALASQRKHGKARIPARWSVYLSVPSGIVLGIMLGYLLQGSDGSFSERIVVCVLTCIIVIVQDCIRFNLISRDLVHGAVLSDGIWLTLLSLTLLPHGFLDTALRLTAYWASTGGIALCTGLVFLAFKAKSDNVLRKTSLREVWLLGKWSGLDSLMSAVANLAPMLITAFVIGNEHAGTYRVLQSSLGPLNILSTSLITMFGLDAWKFVSWHQLTSLRLKVRRALLYMSGFALAYIAVAELLVIAVSGLDSTELVRIAVIVGIVGVMGAATAPLSAAALALGYQKHGAALRLVIVVFSLGVSLLSMAGMWLPWGDPIGTVTLFAAAAGLAGWTISFRRAIRIERSKQPYGGPAIGGNGRHYASRSIG